MAQSDLGSSKTPTVLRDILEEIEVLRIKRQEEVRDRPHPFLKRFTQQELTDEACPTYKNLLVGRSQRIPSRQTLMQIADYLECSIESRNNLLLAARYLPESLELEGDALRLTLEQATPSFFERTCRSENVRPSMTRQSKPGKLGYLAAFSSLSKAIGSTNLNRGIMNWSNSFVPSPIFVGIGNERLQYLISMMSHQSCFWGEMLRRKNGCR